MQILTQKALRVKGEAIYAFVTLAEGTEMTPEVNKGLKVYAAS